MLFMFLDPTVKTHPVGLLWMSDQPLAEAASYTTHTRRTSIHSGILTRDPSNEAAEDRRLKVTGIGPVFV